MTPSVPVGEVRPLGDRAFLIGVADAAAAPGAGGGAGDAALGDGVEVVCGSATVHGPRGRRRRGARRRSGPRSTTVRGGAGPRRRARRRARSGPARHHPVPFRRARPRRGRRAGRLPAPTRWPALLTARPLTAAVIGFSPGFAYLEGLPEPAGPGAPARPAAPGRARRVGGDRQRPRRRLPHRVAGRLAPGRADRLSACSTPQRPPYAVLAPGDRVQLHRGRRGRAGRTGAGGAHRRGPCPAGARAVFEVVGAGPARRRAGRRPPRRRRGRGSRRPGRPTRCRSTLANRLVGQRAAARARWSSRAAGPGCAASARATWPSSGPRRRSGSTAPPSADRPAAAARPGPGARGRPPARAAGAPTWRWPAGSSGPSGSAAPPPTS